MKTAAKHFGLAGGP